MPVAIEFNNISKMYRLGLVSGGTVKADFQRWWTMNILHKEDPFLTVGETNDRSTKGESEYVWALRDIDFKVEQGDVVGIIGKNGAGKSTLLKILSKVTVPTTGTIRARGRIGSLLEVGTGFHPEMTGRENIYMNGAILGMTKAEITKKLDEIVDFSGCERYIDTPVKRYSSGMMVRLGFAVAAHLDPEILVVDEVLAVGDAEFQKKAIGKMQDVSRGEGRTVLFVSHNMAAVRQLCKSAILLENGRMVYSDTANKCVDKYLEKCKEFNETFKQDSSKRDGNGSIRVVNCQMNGRPENSSIQDDEQLVLKINYIQSKEVSYPRIGISVNTMSDDCVLWMDSNTIELDNSEFKHNNSITIHLSHDFTLPVGSYYINIVCYESQSILADYFPHALQFTIEQGSFYKTGFYPIGKSFCMVKQEWTFSNHD